MASEQSTDMDLPAEAFSAVWVKMEVVEDGHVEGVDEDQLDDDNRNDDEDYQDSGDNSREVDETPEVQAPVRRSRRKAARPRKAKNVEEKRFHCEYCDYKALHKASLKYHMMKHLHPEPIRCTSCSYTTNHPNSLRRHVLSVHTDQDDPAILAMPDLKCKDCEYTCKFSWKLFIHRRKHVEKSFRCSLCQFTSSRKANYEKHCRTHRDKESGVYYECDKCPYVTRHEGHISRHLAVIHKEISKDANKCDFCEFSTKIRWRLNIHKKNSRQDEPIKCEFCDYKTEYNCQYKLHKSQHVADMALVASGVALPAHVHLPPNSVVKYPEPGAEGGYGADGGDPPLHNEKDFIIDSECAEVDWRSIEVGEKPGEEKPFHCILCPYKSKFKAAVQRHFQRNHTSDKSKPYKCLNCEFSTKTRDQIALHSKRSKSIFLISCKACEFTTFYKCQMAEHQKLHWRYKCKLCDFICRVSYDLNQHYTVIHLGQGFKCRFCDFKASRKGSLLNHENSHTSKRFQCGLCEYTATRRSLLFNHMKRNHAGEKPKVIITDRKFDMLKKVDETQTEVPKAPNAKEVENEIRNIIKNKLYENKLKFEGGPNDANQCDNLESKLDGDLKNDESNKFEKPFKNIEGKIDSQYKNVEDKIDSQYKNVEDKIDSQYKNVEDKIDSQYKNVDGKIDSQYEHFEGRIDSQYRNVEGKNYSEYKNIEGEVNSQHRHVEDIDSQFKNDTSKSDDQFKGESDKKVENQKMTNSYEFVLPKDDLKNETNEDVTKFENKGSVNRKYNGQIVENNFESPYNNVDRHFRNVEGYNFDQQYRAIDSQFKNSGHFFDRQYKTIDSQFKHVEGNNFDRQYTNVDSRYKNVVSQDKFETQVIIERQNEYENIYQRSIMYGAGQDPRRVGLPGNLYDMEPRPNVFYSPYK